MQTEDAAARERRNLERRKTDRFLDRPPLVGMLALLALPCFLEAVVASKISNAVTSGGPWVPGLAIGGTVAAAAICGGVLAFRSVLRASKRRRERKLAEFWRGHRGPQSGWQEPLLLAVLVVPAIALVGDLRFLFPRIAYSGVEHPRTMFQLIVLGYAAAYLAACISGLAWLTARPYTALGAHRWRLTLHGHCPGPVRVVARPAGRYDSQECEPCYLPVCDCMWHGQPQPVSRPNAADIALAAARHHSPNASLDTD